MNAAHLHLALNHLPVVGILFTLGVLGAGVVLRKEVVSRVALWMAVVCAAVAIPAYLTGEPAEETAERLPQVTEAVIESHEEAAAIALGTVLACGLAAGIGLFLGRAGRPIQRALLVVVLLCACASASACTYTALLGGRIRHTEIR